MGSIGTTNKAFPHNFYTELGRRKDGCCSLIYLVEVVHYYRHKCSRYEGKKQVILFTNLREVHLRILID